MDIYQQLLATGEKIHNHYSDIYVKVTPETTDIINKSPYRQHCSVFMDQIDKVLTYEIPFAFTPFWEQSKLASIFAA